MSIGARPGYFVIAHRNDGWVARWMGGNHTVVLSSGAQLYLRRAGAEKAVLSVARSFYGGGVELVPDQHDGLGSYVWDEQTGQRVEVREVDERRAPTMPVWTIDSSWTMSTPAPNWVSR